jgi:uncharacterized phage protein (TIGR02220 family)
MADQQKWFKLWTTAPADSDLCALTPAERWAWVAFGCHTKAHGTGGSITVRATDSVLAAAMGVTPDALIPLLQRLPHLVISEGQNRNGEFTVTWKNWRKYQSDSTGSERIREWRRRKRVTALEEKRGEEKRREVPPQAPRGASRGLERYTPNGSDPDSAIEFELDQEGQDGASGLGAAPPELAAAVEVLEFLNAKTGRAYGGTRALQLIDARLREGWTVQNCRSMIARKWREWRSDERMSPFVRPSTLFNRGKLEGYMGEMGLRPSAQP